MNVDEINDVVENEVMWKRYDYIIHNVKKGRYTADDLKFAGTEGVHACPLQWGDSDRFLLSFSHSVISRYK